MASRGTICGIVVKVALLVAVVVWWKDFWYHHAGDVERL